MALVLPFAESFPCGVVLVLCCAGSFPCRVVLVLRPICLDAVCLDNRELLLINTPPALGVWHRDSHYWRKFVRGGYTRYRFK